MTVWRATPCRDGQEPRQPVAHPVRSRRIASNSWFTVSAEPGLYSPADHHRQSRAQHVPEVSTLWDMLLGDDAPGRQCIADGGTLVRFSFVSIVRNSAGATVFVQASALSRLVRVKW